MIAHSLPVQVPSHASLLDAVTYIAMLASKPGDIDEQLDRVRAITAQRSATQLTQEDEEVLSEVYVYIEDYLVNKESLRSFTRESIREKLRNHLEGRLQPKRSHPVATTFFVALGSGVAAMLVPDSIVSVTVKATLAMTLFLAILHLGALGMFWKGLRNFKDEIRRAYLPICIGIGLVGMTLLQIPVAVWFGEDDSLWFRYITSSIIVPIAGILFYAGMRRFARIGGIKSRLLSARLVFALCVSLTALVIILPRPSDLPASVLLPSLMILTVGATLSFVTATITAKVRRALSAAYRQPMAWFMAMLLVSAFSCVQYAVLQMFATLDQPYDPAGLAIIPLFISGFVIVKAGASFRRIDTSLVRSKDSL